MTLVSMQAVEARNTTQYTKGPIGALGHWGGSGPAVGCELGDPHRWAAQNAPIPLET